MTRDDAIKIIKECRDFESYSHVREALDMAIKALEATNVLDKISAEIIKKFGNCDVCDWFEDYDYEENNISEYRSVGDISDIIEIINNYKAESEVNADECNL